jgi:small subunit ribosomal protein S1
MNTSIENNQVIENEEFADNVDVSPNSEAASSEVKEGEEVVERSEPEDSEVSIGSEKSVEEKVAEALTEESSGMQDLAQLLDEHDYDSPSVGDIRTAVIVSITSQGIIVDLGLKRDGLIPPADLDELEEEERESFELNEEVPVYIVDTGQPDRLIVSIHKARLNQDWIRASELLESGEIFEAPVINYNRGGVIVPFGNLNGFVPASHLTDLRRGMDDRQRQQAMAKLRDETIPMRVIEVNRRRRRLVLSQRDAQKEWQEARKIELIDKLETGDVIKGTVSGLRSFGAFVDLGGADGLIHISELAWHRVNHPREVVRVGEEVEVYVLSLDREEQRIALSRKRMLPNPWSLAEEKYAINQLVEGRVTRTVSYGAFVEIEPGIEGLLHISQLSRDNVEDVNELISEGEVHLLRIISLDTTRQRIGLSLKSVSESEQIEWMSQREPEEAVETASEEEAEAVLEEAAAEAAIEEAAAEVVESTEEEAADVSEAVEEEAAAEAVEPETETIEEEISEEPEMISGEEVVDVAAAVDQALSELDEEE